MVKEFSSALTIMNYITNKYEYTDDMKSTRDEEKVAAKSMNKNSLAMAYLYQ